MDQAFRRLRTLAESRMGLPSTQAEDHARRTFLEVQYAAASGSETKESFVRRLEQRVAAYEGMPALVQEQASGRSVGARAAKTIPVKEA